MAENKKSFILYADLIHTVRKLPLDKAGELFFTILQYVNDENPEVDDLLVEIAFEPVKQQLKRDLQRWDERLKNNSENGKKGGRPKKANVSEENPNNPPLFFESEKSLNDNDNDNDNVIVSDSVNDNVIGKKKTTSRFAPPSQDMVQEYAIEICKGSTNAPDDFFNYYEARGWMMQKTPMKNWKAAYKNWTKNEKQYEAVKGTNQHKSETKSERNERLYRDYGKELNGGKPLPDIFELCKD